MSESEPDSPNAEPRPPTKDAVAVALAEEGEAGRPPKVVAGGRGRIAEQILEIAFANGVRVREDADLAQMLTSIDIESEIPVEAFESVAEILAFVYETNNARAAPRPGVGADETADENRQRTAARLEEQWRTETET